MRTWQTNIYFYQVERCCIYQYSINLYYNVKYDYPFLIICVKGFLWIGTNKTSFCCPSSWIWQIRIKYLQIIYWWAWRKLKAVYFKLTLQNEMYIKQPKIKRKSTKEVHWILCHYSLKFEYFWIITLCLSVKRRKRPIITTQVTSHRLRDGGKSFLIHFASKNVWLLFVSLCCYSFRLFIKKI